VRVVRDGLASGRTGVETISTSIISTSILAVAASSSIAVTPSSGCSA
jgi:hypothetical protein